MLLTRLPLIPLNLAKKWDPLDLHALSTLPAFILDQDQILKKKIYQLALVNFRIVRDNFKKSFFFFRFYGKRVFVGFICCISFHTPTLSIIYLTTFIILNPEFLEKKSSSHLAMAMIFLYAATQTYLQQQLQVLAVFFFFLAAFFAI